MIKFHCSTFHNFRIQNHLNIYIKITELEESLKNLCKIHFHHHREEGKDFLRAPHKFGWTNSLKSLTNKSGKEISEMIIKYEGYLEQKRN